jgi:adenylosuccinate synthase
LTDQVSVTNPNITIIVGAQWGDEGKGKVTDFFAGESDFVVRFHGGNNAGHTVVVDDQEYKLHLIPSGVVYSRPVSVIGNGVVINPEALIEELAYLERRNIRPRLMISDRAHVIMPYHLVMDDALTGHQGALAAGSTKRGIAPVYADKMYRHGIRMIDLLEPDIFKEKLEKSYQFNKNLIERALQGKLVESLENIYDRYLSYGQQLAPYIQDVSSVLYAAYKDKKSILFEGAQGISLDVDHGIYPHTTSSNTAAGHIAVGTGVTFRHIDRIIGVAKAYVTRVGISPFPTEINDPLGDSLRDKGNEFGTTTGRPRRIGWLDLVQLRQAIRVNGLSELAITKLDVLSGLDELLICTDYGVDDDSLSEIPASLTAYRKAVPVYKTLPGWSSLDSSVSAKGYDSLPGNLREYIRFIEDSLQISVSIISVGPQRHQTIVK